MVNGKAKGGAFEREIAKKLSVWITGTSETNVLWRTAGSGARATQSYKSGRKQDAQIGDLGSIHPAGHWFQQHFICECKNYKNLDLIPFIFKNKGILAGFWKKLLEESNIYSRVPLLIAKQNFIPEFIMTDIDIIGLEPFITVRCVRFYWLNDTLEMEYSKFKDDLTSQKVTITPIN